MSYTNSKLVSYTNLSPFCNLNRNQPITKVTWHHMAGVMSLEQFDSIVHTPNRNMSANYAIDKDARIGLFCNESSRSWCSSSSWNDNRAVTIEISNCSTGGEWPISGKVFNKAIELTADICRRNGIKKLTYTGDKNGSLTFHRMFASTLCPGPYIFKRAQEICDRVNALISSDSSTNETDTQNKNIKVGDLVSISSDAVYYTGNVIPSWVKDEKWFVSSVTADRAVLGLNEEKKQNIQSPVNIKYLTISNSNDTGKSYTVNLKSTDIIYSSPGGNTKGTVGVFGIFTIVDERIVNNVKYGKLKSGVGWVKLNSDIAIQKGDMVRIVKPLIYGTTKTFKVYSSSYKVLEITGADRAVISADGKNVTAAINISNIKKI